MRLAVIGDIGGHEKELREALLGLGVDLETCTLPKDLVVCQVGDLIHRGPNSVGVLKLVDRFIDQDNWVQLCGNHEAQYLFPPRFYWEEELADEGKAILQKWWNEKKMLLAASFNTKGSTDGQRVYGQGPLLITHAGLTAGLWKKLGRPGALEAKELINEVRFDLTANIWDEGTMLGHLNLAAGVAWAEAGREVYTSWKKQEEMPFSQVHGHSSAYRWKKQQWAGELKSWEEGTDISFSLEEKKKILRFTIKEKAIWGVDPGHGHDAVRAWSPLLLELEQ